MSALAVAAALWGVGGAADADGCEPEFISRLDWIVHRSGTAAALAPRPTPHRCSDPWGVPQTGPCAGGEVAVCGGCYPVRGCDDMGDGIRRVSPETNHMTNV